jgi:hypothetical protein
MEANPITLSKQQPSTVEKPSKKMKGLPVLHKAPGSCILYGACRSITSPCFSLLYLRGSAKEG